MTNPTENHEDRRLRRKTAAFRLKHDVGKAVRWSAPEARERNIDELRMRLSRDLLSRASGGGAKEDVLKIFFEWKREEGQLFASDDADMLALDRAMAALERLVPRLAAGLPAFKESSSSLSPLSESQLVALDEACLEASRACTAFYRRIAVGDGPEATRPAGARR